MRLSLVLLLSVFLSAGLQASESEALALLKGIENERMKYNCFRICYTETRVNEQNKTVSQEVDFDYGKIRKFHLKTHNFSGWAEVLNGNELYRFRFIEHEDVQLMDSHSGQAGYSGLYDPRILGLTDSLHSSSNVKGSLLYGRISGFAVKNTTLEERPVKCVSIVEDDHRWDMYIEEPKFRLVKEIYSSPTINITITNRYDNPNLGPFPSESKILRTNGEKIVFDRTIKVTSFEVKRSFPPDTFTYKAMNLPLNTAVVDYRISQRLGYWDGEKLVERPVSISAQEMRELEAKKNRQPLGNAVRYILMGTGIVMIIFALISMYRNRRKK